MGLHATKKSPYDFFLMTFSNICLYDYTMIMWYSIICLDLVFNLYTLVSILLIICIHQTQIIQLKVSKGNTEI